MKVVIDGLQDNLTHLGTPSVRVQANIDTLPFHSVYRPRLERRLTRLEKRLNVPINERHECDGQIKKARELFIEGVRVKNRASSVILDKSGHMRGIVPFFTGQSKSATPSSIFTSTQSLITEVSIRRQHTV